MKFNPLLPNVPSPGKLEAQVRKSANHRLDNGFLKAAYKNAVAEVGAKKFALAGRVVLNEVVETKNMLLRFAKEAAHEGHHDDHGHGHGSDHTPVVKEIGQERLTE